MAGIDRADRTPALHHGGQRGRWQEHADRPPALRFQRRLRRPAGQRAQGDAQSFDQRPGSLAAHRRPAGGARAGHHDRRGVPLLFDAAAQVHHRRHAGPRAVHAQHGHRRVHRQPGHHPDRCALRRAAAVAPPCVSRRAAGDSAPGGGGQQDGPDGVPRGRVQRDSRRIPRVRRAVAWECPMPRHRLHPDQRAGRRQRGQPQQANAVVRGSGAVGAPGDGADRARHQSHRSALPGAVRDPAQSGFSRLRRDSSRRVWCAAATRSPCCPPAAPAG